MLKLFTDDNPEVEISKKLVKCMIKGRVSKESKILFKSIKLGMESIQETYGERRTGMDLPQKEVGTVGQP